jgi:fructose/tagatose bisphosphate aldolase
MRTRLDHLVVSALLSLKPSLADSPGMRTGRSESKNLGQPRQRQGSQIPRRWSTSWRTGAQLLAVAVGNVHGKYIREPALCWDVLQDIAVRTHIPLVLHGASGIPAEELVKASAMNVGKVNFNTELRTGVLAILEANTTDYRADGENLQGLLRLWNQSAKHFAAGALATLSR